MKKLMLILLFATLIAEAQQARTVHYQIGNPVQECRGRGLCDFSISDTDTSLRSTAGKLSLNTFVLNIDRKTLNEIEEVNIIGKAIKDILPGETVYFSQLTPIHLPNQTLSLLHLADKNSRISAGNYPVNITPDFIEVIFTLSPTK